MSKHYIPFFNMKKKKTLNDPICSYGIFPKGLKNEFERAVVNEPSVFEPLKFYYIFAFNIVSQGKKSFCSTCIRINLDFFSAQNCYSTSKEHKIA